MKYESDEIYHDQSGDRPRIGSTALKTYMQNPMLFAGQYVTKTMPMPTPIPAFAIGHAVEALVYGWGDKVITSDMATATSKAHKEAVAANPDKIVLTTKDYDLVNTMADAVCKTEHYATMIANGAAQQAERIHMQDFDLQCKFDWIITEPNPAQVEWFGTGNAIAIDFKTTASMRGSYSNFERGVRTYGYIEQAALYQIIHFEQTGIIPDWFWFVVEKDYPFEVQMFRADPDWLTLGRQRVRDAIESLNNRFATGNWANTEERIETLYQPAWETNNQ